MMITLIQLSQKNFSKYSFSTIICSCSAWCDPTPIELDKPHYSSK